MPSTADSNKKILLRVWVGIKISLYKVARTQPWNYCWFHSFQKLCWKPWCLLLLCQNTHSTNATCALTVGYKFVNDLKNWFSLLWLWHHRTICVTGQKSLIYKNPMAGSEQLCIEKLWVGWNRLFWFLRMEKPFVPWSLVYILQQLQNTLIFTLLTDSKVHVYGVYCCNTTSGPC